MMHFQAAQLMWLEQKKRRLHCGKECRAQNQHCDGGQQRGQGKTGHFLWDGVARRRGRLSLAKERGRVRLSSEELVVGGLLIL